MATADDGFAVLRDARPALPSELASPRSAAAEALLEEILSMQTIDAPDVVTTEPPAFRSRWRIAAVAAVAALTLAAAAVAAIGLGHGNDGRGGDTVRVGPADPSGSTTTSGRLEVESDLDWDMVPPGARTVTNYEWSGHDVRSTQAADRSEFRQVDGRAWVYTADLSSVGPDGTTNEADLPHQWYTTNPQESGPWTVDPATLLDTLGGADAFTTVGDEDVAGVPTHHQRALQPRQVPVGGLDLQPFFPSGVLTSVEVWVDDEGTVRRLDVTWSGNEQGKAFTDRRSLVWSDLGDPITIEPPPVG